jgi:hypothetical protein
MAAIFMSPASFRVIEHSRQPASNEWPFKQSENLRVSLG